MHGRGDFLKELAANFAKLSETERQELADKVFEKAGNKIEYYKKV